MDISKVVPKWIGDSAALGALGKVVVEKRREAHGGGVVGQRGQVVRRKLKRRGMLLAQLVYRIQKLRVRR